MPTIKVTAEELLPPMATRNWEPTPAPARRTSMYVAVDEPCHLLPHLLNATSVAGPPVHSA